MSEVNVASTVTPMKPSPSEKDINVVPTQIVNVVVDDRQLKASPSDRTITSTVTANTERTIIEEKECIPYINTSNSITTENESSNENTLLFENFNNSWSLLPEPEVIYTRLCFIYYCEILASIPHALTKSSEAGLVPISVAKLLWQHVLSTQTQDFTDRKEELDEMVNQVYENLTSKFGFFVEESVWHLDVKNEKVKVSIKCMKFSNKLYEEYGMLLLQNDDEHFVKTKQIKKVFVKGLLKELGFKTNFVSLEENYEDFLTTLHEVAPVNGMYYYVIMACCYLLPCLTLKAPSYYLLQPKYTSCRLSVLDIDHGTSIVVADVQNFSDGFENPMDQIQAFEVIASCVHVAMMNTSENSQEQTEIGMQVAHAFRTVAKHVSAMNRNPAKYYHEALAVYEDLLDNCPYLQGTNSAYKKIIQLDMAETMQKLGNCIAYESSGLKLDDNETTRTPLNHMDYLKHSDIDDKKVSGDSSVTSTKSTTTTSVNHKAMAFYDRTFQIRRLFLGPQHPLVADTLHCIGVLYFEAKLYSYALSCFTETLRIRRAPSTDDNSSQDNPGLSRDVELSIAETLEWIGHSHFSLKKYHCAITNLNEALVIRSIHCTKDHEDIAALYQTIGMIYDEIREYEASLLRFSEALRIRRICYQRIIDKKDRMEKLLCMESIFETLCCSGNVHSKLEKIKDALDCYTEAMTLKKSILHERLPDFQYWAEAKDDARVLPLPMYIHFSTTTPSSSKGACLTTLASLTSDNEENMFQETIRTTPGLQTDFRALFNLMARIVELSIMKYGEDHVNVSLCISQMAELYIQNGSYKKAMKCLQEVLRILSLSDDYREMTISATYRLAMCYARTFETTDAMRLYENVLQDLDDEKKNIDVYFQMPMEDEEDIVAKYDKMFSEVEALLTSVKKDIDLDDMSDSLSDCSAIEVHVKLPKMEHILLISDIYYNLGNAQFSKGANDKAFVSLLYALQLRQHVMNDEESTFTKEEQLVYFANVYQCLAVCYVLVSGNYERGCDVFERKILPLFEECYAKTNPNHVSIGHSCYYLGQMYQGLAIFSPSNDSDEAFDQYNLDKALDYYNRAIRIYRFHYKKDHILFGHVYLSVGSIYDSRCMFTKALRCFNFTLRVYTKFNKNGQHLGVAIVLNSLGIVCAAIGEEKAALKYFQKSCELKKLLMGDDHASVSDSYHNLGGVYAKLGMFSDSMNCYKECLNIRIRTYGENNLLVAKTYSNMGIVHTQLRQFKLAMTRFKEALRIRRSYLPPDSEDLAATYYNIGNIHARENEYDMAVECYTESIRIRRKLFGDDSIIVANTLQNMGALYEAKMDYTQAKVCYEDALQVKRLRFGEDDYAVALAMTKVGTIYNHTGDYQQALTCFEKALKVQQQCYGLEHIEIAQTLIYLGESLMNIESTTIAMNCFIEALRIREMKLPENHEDIADALYFIGKVYDKKEDYEDAMLYYGNAFRIYKRRGKRRGKDRERVMNALRALVLSSNGQVGTWDTLVVTGDCYLTIEKLIADLVDILRLYVMEPTSAVVKGTFLCKLQQILELAGRQAIILNQDADKYRNALSDTDGSGLLFDE